MRQETNNEIDLLLRRLGRRQGVHASDADSHNDLDHLDADELNSYAENALPTAARARYTEHLAECLRCRELVVQLSASVPVVAAKETVTAAEPSGLRKFLASFFSPMVLRYAVPALGLIVVAAIGLVVFRSKMQPNSVARLNESAQSAPAVPQSEEPSLSTFNDSRASADPPLQGVVSPGKTTASTETQPAATPEAKPAESDKVEPKRDETIRTAEPQVVANAAPAPPAKAPAAPAPAATVDDMRVDVEGRRANEQARAGTTLDLAKQKSAEEVKEQEKKGELGAASAQRRARARGAGTQAADTNSAYVVQSERQKEKDSEDGVIRSAGGRRFRKQGEMWVDTAYNSSSAIVDVSRSSEQYRALVADEPTIKTIADELDGIVVVVWKGRTYRIR